MMGLLNKLIVAGQITKVELKEISRTFAALHEMVSSYYQQKDLENEEFLTIIIQTPILYFSNLIKNYST